MTGIATVHGDIRAAFRARLTALADLPDVAWEGKTYADKVGTPFIRESVRPIYTRKSSVGVAATMEHRIVGNLTLFYPAGEGTLEIDAMAGALMAHFMPGTGLAYGTSSAWVENVERSALVQEPNWQSCTVTITLTAFTAG